MHKDFLTAIQNNEDPQVVYERLRSKAEKAYHIAVSGYNRDKENCMRIFDALKEPGTFMFEWAQSYRRQAEKEEADKSKEKLEREALRRRLEEEYLAEIKKKTELMRQEWEQHHSDR